MSQRSGLAADIFDLLKPFWPLLLGAAGLGVVGGASVAGLLTVVNRGLYATSDDVGMLASAFVGLCALVLVGTIGADICTNYVGQKIIGSLRKSLAAKILAAPIDELERYRSHRLIPVLTHDVDTISDFAFFLSTFFVALVIVMGCMIYLATLSLSLFLIVAAVVIVGSAAQAIARTRGVKGFSAARASEDELHKHYKSIAEGAKELRINRQRRQRVHAEKIDKTIDKITAVQIRSINVFVSARAFGTVLFFAAIGAVLLLRPVLLPDSPASVSSGFVLVMLFMRGPIDQIISVLPSVSRAQVALRRIADLTEKFSAAEPGLLGMRESASERDQPHFNSIELRDASYAFQQPAGRDGFKLGPVDFSVRRGEIVFIVGENGSGKTTLIKLLLGLYVPVSGDVYRDGVAVTAKDRDAFRQLFTTIFSDYYLFEDLMHGDGEVPDIANRYLERLEVADKVSVEAGAFSTLDLSTGQRKRLALMNAWLEDRPILVFDEWAADQDPAFRDIFYSELLPELQRSGKTIVVISHDDRYFSVADRIVRLRGGRVITTELTKECAG